jgi:hypothetical protein
MGKRNQIYCKWVRILKNPEDDNEIYLVLRKDKPMELKYIRQFENMFQGTDVLITIVKLIRNKKEDESKDWEPDLSQIKTIEESLKESKEKKKREEDKDEDADEVPEKVKDSPLWGYD